MLRSNCFASGRKSTFGEKPSQERSITILGWREKRRRHISDIISNDKSALRQQTVSFLPSSDGSRPKRDESGPKGFYAGNGSNMFRTPYGAGTFLRGNLVLESPRIRPLGYCKSAKANAFSQVDGVQCSCSGWPTGYGKKLSRSQAQLGQAKCLAVASFLSISCGPS